MWDYHNAILPALPAEFGYFKKSIVFLTRPLKLLLLPFFISLFNHFEALSLTALPRHAAAFGIGFLHEAFDEKESFICIQRPDLGGMGADPAARLPPRQPMIICPLVGWPEHEHELAAASNKQPPCLPPGFSRKINSLSAVLPKIHRWRAVLNGGQVGLPFCELQAR